MSKIGSIYIIPSVLSEGSQETTISNGIIQAIDQLNYFAVENVRTARRFIRAVNKEKVIEHITFKLLNKQSSKRDIDAIIQDVLIGNDIGILSEAGCPGIADPGAKLIDEAHLNGVKVIPLVGPNSILLALMGSGMNGQGFTFHGYLPIKEGERKKALKGLEGEMHRTGYSQIFMETPYRNNQLFSDVLKTLNPGTKLCVASNLTSKEEYLETMTIKDWKRIKIDLNKKPTIFVLGQ